MKQWVRPALIPVLRLFVRYPPAPWLRRLLWNSIVERYLSYGGHAFVARTVFGSRIAGNTSDFIARYIYYFGVWEPNLTRWLQSRLKPGDAFLDVGANIGYFTLLAARLVGMQGQVIAVEASPNIHGLLMANLSINGVRNTIVHNIAAADVKSKLKLYFGDPGNLGTGTLRAKSGALVEAEVPAERLADVVDRDTMKRVRVIKIDVEGAEARVIDGMMPLLAYAGPSLEIVVEIRPQTLLEQGRDVNQIFAAFAHYGFHPYALLNDYSARDYMESRLPEKPQRIRGKLAEQTDVIFSRVDADAL